MAIFTLGFFSYVCLAVLTDFAESDLDLLSNKAESSILKVGGESGSVQLHKQLLCHLQVVAFSYNRPYRLDQSSADLLRRGQAFTGFVHIKKQLCYGVRLQASHVM